MMIKKILSLSLSALILISGCSQNGSISTDVTAQPGVYETTVTEEETQISQESNTSDENIPVSEITDLKLLPIAEGEDADPTPYEYEVNFDNLDSQGLQRYVTDTLYESVVSELECTDYYVSGIGSVYISQEYIDELTYNSKTNIFFGYSLEELDQQFQGERYLFTLGDQSDTIVTAYEEYDDSYDRMIQNVSTGTGVILMAINLSGKTSESPTVSMIFAFSALTGTVVAVSAAGLAGLVTAMVVGVSTGDMDEAKKEAMLVSSEVFKWGAIAGTVAGAAVGTYEVLTAPPAVAGTADAVAGMLLSPNEVYLIQQDLKYPIYLIQQFYGMEEVEELKAANLVPELINGAIALIKTDIDLEYVDELGRTNEQRMLLGLAPCDSEGNEYLLRLIGEGAEYTLAVLSQDEAASPNLSNFVDLSESNLSNTSDIRKKFWKTMAVILLEMAD